MSLEPTEGQNSERSSNLLDELTDTDQELNLVLGSYFLRVPELELRGSKVFRGETAGNTELTIAVSKLKGSGRLVFENLIVVMDGEVMFEGFEKVEFRNVKLRAEEPVRFINTTVELYGRDVVGCLHVENAKLSAENSEFHDSNLSAIYSVGSSVVLKDCKIAKNKGGEEYRAQLRLINSEAELLWCKIAESENIGIHSMNSKIRMLTSEVYGNKLGGLIISSESKNSEVYNMILDNCKVYANAIPCCSQISISNSTAIIKNYSEIYNSNGGVGLEIWNSKVDLSLCSIYNNSKMGISAKEGTELTIQNCDINNNAGPLIQADRKVTYPQVFIYNSKAVIKDSKIHTSNGFGLSSYSSNVLLVGGEIRNNIVDIIRTEDSSFANYDCKVDLEKVIEAIREDLT